MLARNAKSIPAYFSVLLNSDGLTMEMVEDLERKLAERKKELEEET